MGGKLAIWPLFCQFYHVSPNPIDSRLIETWLINCNYSQLHINSYIYRVWRCIPQLLSSWFSRTPELLTRRSIFFLAWNVPGWNLHSPWHFSVCRSPDPGCKGSFFWLFQSWSWNSGWISYLPMDSHHVHSSKNLDFISGWISYFNESHVYSFSTLKWPSFGIHGPASLTAPGAEDAPRMSTFGRSRGGSSEGLGPWGGALGLLGLLGLLASFVGQWLWPTEFFGIGKLLISLTSQEMFNFNVSAMGFGASEPWMSMVLDQLDDLVSWRSH